MQSNNSAARVHDQSGDDDVTFGYQATVSFPAVTVLEPAQPERPAIDSVNRRDIPLWRLSAIALQPTQLWRLRLIYGTSSSIEIQNIRAPLVAYVPGSVQLYALPIGQTAAVNLYVSLKPAFGYNLQHVRSILDNQGGGAALDIPPSGVRFTALVASTVNMAGAAIALGVNASLLITGPATLAIGGLGIVEHEL